MRTVYDLAAPWIEMGRASAGVEVTADPVTVDLDPGGILQAAAEVATEVIRAGVRAISATAAPATLEARAKAAKAWAAGKRWARERYPNGPPLHRTLFNASGRLASHLAARAVKRGEDVTWEVTAPADRFGETFGLADFERMVSRLRELVPALADPLADPRVAAAVERAVDKMVAVGRERR